MAVEFKILRGSSKNLTVENLAAANKLVNGYWYLTNDTAEVYVCLEDTDGNLVLRKINECNTETDFPEIESFETRLQALESEEKLHTYGYRSGFPVEGQEGHMYVAVDECKTYIWWNNEYAVVGGGDNAYEEPNVIFGGTAD